MSAAFYGHRTALATNATSRRRRFDSVSRRIHFWKGFRLEERAQLCSGEVSNGRVFRGTLWYAPFPEPA